MEAFRALATSKRHARDPIDDEDCPVPSGHVSSSALRAIYGSC
jgi:hypothetical protein